MATKNNPGAFDCYSKAKPDEPMFVLLGRDKHAPALVWLWATLREIDGEDEAKVAEARACMRSMIEWGGGAVGVGQAALAAVLELIRAANASAALVREKPKNEPTTIDDIRAILCEVIVESL